WHLLFTKTSAIELYHEFLLRITFIRRRNARPRRELVSLLRQKLFERGEKEQHVRRSRAKAHQADPPDLALVRAKARADFDAEPREQGGADGPIIDSFGHEDGIEHRQLMPFLRGILNADGSQAGFEGPVVPQVASKAVFQ